MTIKLYHFTSRESAEQIVKRGFAGDSCWLAPDVETPCGEAARSALIEVLLSTPR